MPMAAKFTQSKSRRYDDLGQIMFCLAREKSSEKLSDMVLGQLTTISSLQRLSDSSTELPICRDGNGSREVNSR